MDKNILIYLGLIVIIIVIINNITNTEKFSLNDDNKSQKIAIVSMIMKPVDLSIWLNHHRSLGVSLFFIRLEETPELIDFLEKQEDVILEIGESDKNGNNYLTQNYRQDTLVNNSINKCISIEKESRLY